MTTGWAEARQVARDAAEPLEAITVTLREALGLAIAEHLPALVPLPLCDTAAMDGYAVRGDGPWTIVGRRLAGPCTATVIEPGQAYEIATGAPVPAGTEAVLPVEMSSVDGNTLSGTPPAKTHIRRRGEDVPRGRRVLQAGTVVTPAVLGLAGFAPPLPRWRPRQFATAVMTAGAAAAFFLLLAGSFRLAARAERDMTPPAVPAPTSEPADPES